MLDVQPLYDNNVQLGDTYNSVCTSGEWSADPDRCKSFQYAFIVLYNSSL